MWARACCLLRLLTACCLDHLLASSETCFSSCSGWNETFDCLYRRNYVHIIQFVSIVDCVSTFFQWRWSLHLRNYPLMKFASIIWIFWFKASNRNAFSSTIVFQFTRSITFSSISSGHHNGNMFKNTSPIPTAYNHNFFFL